MQEIIFILFPFLLVVVLLINAYVIYYSYIKRRLKKVVIKQKFELYEKMYLDVGRFRENKNHVDSCPVCHSSQLNMRHRIENQRMSFAVCCPYCKHHYDTFFNTEDNAIWFWNTKASERNKIF